MERTDENIIIAREYKVVKANSLIQKSRFSLSAQEQKIVLYLISKIKPDDKEFIEYEFKITEFCKMCGIDYDNGKNYQNLKTSVKNLSDKSFWVSEEKGERLLRWINEAFISKSSGIIKIKISEHLKPYLLELKERFTQFELLYTLAMKSQYSIRIYELLKSYEWKRQVTFNIDELKRTINAENYKRQPDFKRKVLEIALREINELSDINIEYFFIKEGRKFKDIKFLIKTKKEIGERLHAYSNIEKKLKPKKQVSKKENFSN